MTTKRTPALHAGWQAHISLVQIPPGTLQITKDYGLSNHWPKEQATSVLDAAESFQDWVAANGVAALASSDQRCLRTNTGWILRLTQSYQGPDCEMLALSHNHPAHDTIATFRQLLQVAARLTINPKPPVLRVEVKPRDFCIKNNNPVLVDTYPPVLALRAGRYNCARRTTHRTCVAPRERREVLDITGNHRAKLVKLIATCGPLDIDDPAPAITLMMPTED